jgi:hypothetical protein
VSTADCERDFSTLGRIKTKLRNSLAQHTLNDLMTLSTANGATAAQLRVACSNWYLV